MSMYTNDILVSDVRTAAMLPDASSATFTDADILRLADREMQSKLIPLVMGVQEAYWDFDATAALVQDHDSWSVGYRIPSRAIGGKFREINLIDNNNTYRNVAQITQHDIAARQPGFLIKGNLVYFFNPWGSWTANTVQMTYSMRPGRLVLPTDCAMVTSINSSTEVGVDQIPSSFTGSATYDIVRGVPGFECMDVERSAATGTLTMTFTELPDGLAVGDFIALAGESPVPQLPLELHPLLVQRTVTKVLESLGDREGMAAAQAKAQEIEGDALKVLSPRVDYEPKRVVNRTGPFRRFRRPVVY